MAIFHITPINDLEPHDEEGMMCKCEPKASFNDQGHMIITHNSFDGRELLEKIEAGFKK